MTIVKTGADAEAPGRFGRFGGRYVPETLMAAVTKLEESYAAAREDEQFLARLEHLSRTYAGRPTPLTLAERLTEQSGGTRIYLKREDLAHTGAHKINNALGQVLLAQRMGKTRIIAETGAGQHGVATATVCALLGLECVVYMGEEDIHRQAPNVFRMRLLGADVVSVTSGSRTLKDAVNEAMRDWVTNVANTYYVIGSVVGPHPYPVLVRDFQSVIGIEAREQMLEAGGTAADAPGGVRGGRQQRDGPVPRVLRRLRRCDGWRGGCGAWHRFGGAQREPWEPVSRGCCTGRSRRFCRTSGGK